MSIHTTMTKTITAHVDEDLYDRLEQFQESQLLKPSKSEVIRAALSAYLDEHFENESDAS